MADAIIDGGTAVTGAISDVGPDISSVVYNDTIADSSAEGYSYWDGSVFPKARLPWWALCEGLLGGCRAQLVEP